MDADFDEDKRIIDFLSDTRLEDRPEERVRQKYLKILHFEYHYPKNVLAREVEIYYGGQVLKDPDDNPVRADIAVYENALARTQHDQGRIRFVVEVKAPDETAGHNQLVSYIFNTSANGAVWYNGELTKYYRRLSVPENKLIPWPGTPSFSESWDAVGRQRKSQLVDPADIKGLFRRCHDKLHRRGTAGDDVTFDMVRIIIAKCRDEEKEGDVPEFYCTPEEYETPEGRELVAERVERLFEEFRNANLSVFDAHEKITVGVDQVTEVVSELQHYRLVSDNERQWDVMGAAYEEYTADELKKEGGEFFTNRLVVNLLVKLVDVNADDVVLDPAGGTGGFCTAALRYARKKVQESNRTRAVKTQLIEQIKNHVFYIDIKDRLVKFAKTAMILTADGHEGCIRGDSLGPIAKLNPTFLEHCKPGAVTKALTNPPFAGQANGRIADPKILDQFQLGKHWEWRDNKFVSTEKLSSTGTPPETLFLERCVEWLEPGGILGIVQPKGVLDTTEYHLATRHFIFRNCKVLAVINCHKNTFQPYTGSRTSLLVLQKKPEPTEFDADDDYTIFMAVSRKIGQDSEGKPIFKKDDDGNNTGEIDHDLDDIFNAWKKLKNNGFKKSEYIFTTKKSDIDPKTLNINPQRFLPSLNKSLRHVLRIGEQEGWSVTTIAALPARVYKGARFKREDLEAENLDGAEVKKFFTPSALLQERGENVKYLDLSKAKSKRKKVILQHVLNTGQILVTRSGTIGRTMYVTPSHQGVIGSDDLIRIEIADENLRYYVYGFLKTKLGQDQMKRNEYGTIQQHLEPRHIRDMVIPIPDDHTVIERLATEFRKSVKLKEESYGIETTSLAELENIHGKPNNHNNNQ